MHNRSDMMRQLLELGLNYGRKHKSSQTGYLHYCYNQNEEHHLPIPTVENFLLALNLLRSRTIENITEAKVILEGLLHFQNRNEEVVGQGNFPIYLHEYPNCKDRFIGVQVAIVIYWTLKQFHQILGQKLKLRLEFSLLDLLKHLLSAHSEKAAHYPTAIKIAAVARMGGELLHQNEIELEGEKLLKQLETEQNSIYWYSPESIGDMLTGLTMVYHRLSDSPWSRFWHHLENTWHRKTCCYIGPGIKEWQQGQEPQVTLYDLFMSYFTGKISTRITKECPVHLEAALIPPFEDTFSEVNYPLEVSGTFDDAKWSLYHSQDIAYCVIEQKMNLPQSFEKGVYPLKFIWGDHQHVHSFVCQGGKGKLASFLTAQNKIVLTFDLDGPVEVEDRELGREIAFCIDHSEEVKFLVSGEKSSTFTLGENVNLQAGDTTLELIFELVDGNGRFMGHRMLGNRLSQLNSKGSHRYDAYDWLIFLRTLKRLEKCRINVTIGF